MTNQMGDVISIVYSNGVEIAGYEYDEWGKLILAYASDETNELQVKIANTNPILYRGYYYDTETGYYYLQSNYYNPINNSDKTGLITLADLIGAIIGAIVGVVGGYFLSRWIADKLRLSGWKRKAFIAGITAVITASAAAIRYFLGPYVKEVATTLINALRSSFKPKIGTKVGRLGILTRNTKPTIKGLTKHGLARMQQRGISKKLAQEIVKKGYAVSQSGGKVLYFTKKGVVVLNRVGQVVTAYSSKYFDSAMQGIIKLFYK